MRSIPTLIALLATTALAACGGGGGGGAKTILLTATGIDGLDGTIRLESTTGLCEIDVANEAQVGEKDDFPTAGKFVTYWGFLTFDISTLPSGANVQSAVVHARIAAAQGDNLFGGGLFGNVVMEHIDLGPALDPADMTTASLSGEVVGGNATPTFLATNGALEFKMADVTKEVRRDLTDGRMRTSLRLRCQVTQMSDNDDAVDIINFHMFNSAAPNNAQNRPFLEIRYTK